MARVTEEQLTSLREKIEQQRTTIESLKREGHDCPDAELQLKNMMRQLLASARRKKSNSVKPPRSRQGT